MQFVFAGKAHPLDDSGKELIREVIQFIKKHNLQGKMVFLEDYDMNLARTMVQGVDVWLNTPRRPLEASGTSGMKVLPNGGLNFSVLDGWWVEGFSAETGWAIGQNEEHNEPELQDEMDANSIYDLLEHEIIPLFYQRDSNDVPLQWVERMKSSLKTLSPLFNSDRMLQEYTEKYYLPGLDSAERFSADNWSVTRDFTDWMHKLKTHWSGVKISRVNTEEQPELVSGDSVTVSCTAELGGLTTDDVTVQLYYGRVNGDGELKQVQTMDMELAEGKSTAAWQCELPCSSSGRHGFNVRVIPRHPEMINPMCPGMVVWAQE